VAISEKQRQKDAALREKMRTADVGILKRALKVMMPVIIVEPKKPRRRSR